jgi:DNA invertase Pin-like site-specific DNA recombinase
MTAWGYIRTAVANDPAVERQKQSIEECAVRLGYPPPHHVHDDGIPATVNFFQRPGGARLERDTRPGDVLIVADLTRIARELADCVAVANYFASKGVAIVTPDQP